VRDALAPLQQFPRLGPELAGRWEGFRFILGSWRWMLLVYVFDEDRDRVVVVTVQECENVDRCYRAVLPGVVPMRGSEHAAAPAAEGRHGHPR